MRVVFGLVLRTQLGRGRVVALGAVAALGMVLGVAVARSTDAAAPSPAAFDLVEGYGLSLLVPLTVLVFAAGALGDPAEDGTLVYLWSRPVARWRITAGALAAAVAVAVPFAVLPTAAIAALAGGGSGLVAGAALSSLLAVSGYAGLFLALGLVVRRALAWGLAYTLIWEGFVARSGTGAARLSILVYARSVLAEVADQAPPRLAASPAVAVVTPVVVGALAAALTAWMLTRVDVR